MAGNSNERTDSMRLMEIDAENDEDLKNLEYESDGDDFDKAAREHDAFNPNSSEEEDDMRTANCGETMITHPAHGKAAASDVEVPSKESGKLDLPLN